MSDPALEAAYDVLSGIGKPMPDIAAEWIAASRAATEAAGPPLTVHYADDPALAYDIFRPEGPVRGAVIFLHGGFWLQGSKDMVAFPLRRFTEAGLCYVAVSYGLAPRYSLDRIIANVHGAAASLVAHAPSIGLDPARIALIGHSAGAHLAASLAAAPDRPFRPLGSLLISGLFDLQTIGGLAKLAPLGLDSADLARLSIRADDLAEAGPIVLAVGTHEPAGFQAQTNDLAHGLAQACAPRQCIASDGDDHFSIARGLGTVHAPLLRAVLSMFA